MNKFSNRIFLSVFLFIFIFFIFAISFNSKNVSYAQINSPECGTTFFGCCPACVGFDTSSCMCIPAGCELSCTSSSSSSSSSGCVTAFFGCCPACTNFDTVSCKCLPEGCEQACSSSSSGITTCSPPAGGCCKDCTGFDASSCSCVPLGCESSCQTSSGDPFLFCNVTENCPIARCPSQKTYQRYSCQNKKCHEVIFKTSPCPELNSTNVINPDISCKCPDRQKWDGTNCINKTLSDVCPAISAPVCGCDKNTYDNSCFANTNGVKGYTKGNCISNLNKRFNGTWTAKVPKCDKLLVLPGSSSGNCIDCPKEPPICEKDFVLVPNSCTKCARCKKCKNKGTITIKICTKGGILKASIDQKLTFAKAQIILDKISSNEEFTGFTTDFDGKNRKINFKLVNSKLEVTIDDSEKFVARKTGTIASCNEVKPKVKCCKSLKKKPKDSACIPTLLELTCTREKETIGCCPPKQCKRPCGPFCCQPKESCIVIDACMGEASCSQPAFIGCGKFLNSSSGGL